MVAAYFANQPAERDGPGEVFAVEPGAFEFVNSELASPSPFEIEKIAFVYPSTIATRIASQRGLFSVHPSPTSAMMVRQGDRYPFPEDLKFETTKLLHRLGFDEQFLMGELDGLAATLKWRFINGMILA
jgi:hypothetical protein